MIDELAYFTAVAGTDAEQHEIETLIRDLVARGRAVGIIVIAATQRPSAEIVPTKLRDLFGYRAAFRCTTDSEAWYCPGPDEHVVWIVAARAGHPKPTE